MPAHEAISMSLRAGLDSSHGHLQQDVQGKMALAELSHALQGATLDDGALLFSPHSDPRWANLGLQPIPRFLFRVYTPRSDGFTDETVACSRDAKTARPGSDEDIFASQAPEASASLIAQHLWWNRCERRDNLVSWSSSMLFLIRYMFYRHYDNSDGSSLDNINLLVLGVLNEHPKALEAITTTQSLTLSAFLEPAIQAATTELRPSLMNQMAVQLTTICLRLVAQVLSTEDNRATAESGPGYQKFAEVVQRELDKALPYFDWQAKTNQFGRARYLMALLEEALRVLRTETESLIKGLQSYALAKATLQDVAQAIANSEYSPVEVCGEWAAETLLKAWPLKATESKGEHRDSTVPTNAPLRGDKQGRDQPSYPSTASEDDSDDAEFPPLSSFVRKKPSKRDSATLAHSGKSEDDPICVSDFEADRTGSSARRCSKRSDEEVARTSYRKDARKVVDYNTRRHPQDEDIFGTRKRRKGDASS